MHHEIRTKTPLDTQPPEVRRCVERCFDAKDALIPDAEQQLASHPTERTRRSHNLCQPSSPLPVFTAETPRLQRSETRT